LIISSLKPLLAEKLPQESDICTSVPQKS